MATVIGGPTVGAFAAHRNSAGPAMAAAALLGAGYGLTPASGLREAKPPGGCPPSGRHLRGFRTPLSRRLSRRVPTPRLP
ncbi:hypothetical protein AB0M68_40005 [Streptomyces sp. NPDC051453]|uniref:hypothetical protein n=1 Tax=Streptomyces sp. NPDC051453 TaxID=3154941 RepID=UPI003413E87E